MAAIRVHEHAHARPADPRRRLSACSASPRSMRGHHLPPAGGAGRRGGGRRVLRRAAVHPRPPQAGGHPARRGRPQAGGGGQEVSGHCNGRFTQKIESLQAEQAGKKKNLVRGDGEKAQGGNREKIQTLV
ncbi:MAG: hypothetical protein MZV70_50855 [Desulfobacterales bacterium]|nr:hypothetical protein [Desulfobacterales bacterium]